MLHDGSVSTEVGSVLERPTSDESWWKFLCALRCVKRASTARASPMLSFIDSGRSQPRCASRPPTIARLGTRDAQQRRHQTEDTGAERGHDACSS